MAVHSPNTQGGHIPTVMNIQRATHYFTEWSIADTLVVVPLNVCFREQVYGFNDLIPQNRLFTARHIAEKQIQLLSKHPHNCVIVLQSQALAGGMVE